MGLSMGNNSVGIDSTRDKLDNSVVSRAISQIPECTCSVSHSAPFGIEMYTFLFWMEHRGIWNRYILGFVNWVSCARSTRSGIYFREKCSLKLRYHACYNCEKIWNSAQINLSLTLNFYWKYFSPQKYPSRNRPVKSTLIWRKMKSNCI